LGFAQTTPHIEVLEADGSVYVTRKRKGRDGKLAGDLELTVFLGQ
jgi:hypothetical protein